MKEEVRDIGEMHHDYHHDLDAQRQATERGLLQEVERLQGIIESRNFPDLDARVRLEKDNEQLRAERDEWKERYESINWSSRNWTAARKADKEEIERLQKALRFYAEQDEMHGKVARAALKESGAERS